MGLLGFELASYCSPVEPITTAIPTTTPLAKPEMITIERKNGAIELQLLFSSE